MTKGQIQIRKARQNNLVGVDVDLPQNRLIAVTGVSGSLPRLPTRMTLLTPRAMQAPVFKGLLGP
jgi:hypothetical protein